MRKVSHFKSLVLLQLFTRRILLFQQNHVKMSYKSKNKSLQSYWFTFFLLYYKILHHKIREKL